MKKILLYGLAAIVLFFAYAVIDHKINGETYAKCEQQKYVIQFAAEAMAKGVSTDILVGGVRKSNSVKNESVIEALYQMTPETAHTYEKSVYKACVANPDAY